MAGVTNNGRSIPFETLGSDLPPWPPHVRIPNFFLVGAPRCGTTALYTYLSEHPDIFFPAIKEPDFFAEYLGTHRRVRNWADYYVCFAAAKDEKRVGEASVSYLASPTTAATLKQLNPNASIIIMLRNPLDVMHSMYHLRRFSNLEDLSTFEAALRADAGGRRVIELPYRERVRFAEQVERYFRIFGREKVHVIIYDDFKSHTLEVYRRVLQFLEVAPDSRTDFPIINGNRRARNRSLWTVLRRPPMALRRLVHPITSRKLRKSVGSFLLGLNTIREARPPVDVEVRNMLREDLTSEVRRLSDLLGRDLTSWSTAAEHNFIVPNV